MPEATSASAAHFTIAPVRAAVVIFVSPDTALTQGFNFNYSRERVNKLKTSSLLSIRIYSATYGLLETVSLSPNCGWTRIFIQRHETERLETSEHMMVVFFCKRLNKFKSSFKQSCMSESHYSLECIPSYLRTRARCRWKDRTGAFCVGSLGQITNCVVQMRLQKTGAPSQSLSVLPDHFGATLADLHVHHAARVDIGSQVDLWELRLRNTREEKHTLQLDVWHIVRQMFKFVFSVWILRTHAPTPGSVSLQASSCSCRLHNNLARQLDR